MAKFWDNVSGPWKVFCLFGGFTILIAAIVLFPDAFQRLVDTIMNGLRAFADLFQGG